MGGGLVPVPCWFGDAGRMLTAVRARFSDLGWTLSALLRSQGEHDIGITSAGSFLMTPFRGRVIVAGTRSSWQAESAREELSSFSVMCLAGAPSPGL